MADVRWLGFEWDGLFYASDYFQQLYDWAEELIKKGKGVRLRSHAATRSAEDYRGTLDEGSRGKDSPYRNRTVEENLDLFQRMKAGEFPDGSRTLRAKIDMASPNFNLRDPVMYRILRAHHHRTGDRWCIYPMYDWAHGECDSIEKITHSICTLEFENHRPLYDWFIQELGIFAPQQIEFARLNLTYTMMSKRKLLAARPQKGHVNGLGRSAHADAFSGTLGGAATRQRPSRTFCERHRRVEVSAAQSTWPGWRTLSAPTSTRRPPAEPDLLAVLRPLKVVIDNFPEGKTEELDAVNNPEDPSAGTRKLPFFVSELYIERRRLPRRRRPSSSSAWRPAARSACAGPSSSSATRSSRMTRPAMSSSCAAHTTRPRAAAMPRMAVR